MSHRHAVRTLLAALAVVGLAAACGSDSSSGDTSSGATTAAPSETGASTPGSGATGGSAPEASTEVCEARDNLKTSIDDLRSVDVIASGTSGIQDALGKVKDNLAALRSAAGDDLQPQVKAVEDSLSALESAVKDIGSGGAAAVVSAAQDVGQSASTLLTSLQDLKCD